MYCTQREIKGMFPIWVFYRWRHHTYDKVYMKTTAIIQNLLQTFKNGCGQWSKMSQTTISYVWAPLTCEESMCCYLYFKSTTLTIYALVAPPIANWNLTIVETSSTPNTLISLVNVHQHCGDITLTLTNIYGVVRVCSPHPDFMS